jgi:hypothetical protein
MSERYSNVGKIRNKFPVKTNKSQTSKCSFGFSELEFLGHIAGRGVIKPIQDKVASIKHFPIPKTKKNEKQVLNVLNEIANYH